MWAPIRRKPLTERAKKFCVIYVENGYNGKRAYMEAYNNQNEQTSQVGSYQLMKDPRVQAEIAFLEGTYKSLAYKVGLTKEKVVQTLIDMMNATKVIVHKDWPSEVVPDWFARNNAISQYSKLTWDFNEKNKEIEKKLELDARVAEATEEKDVVKLWNLSKEELEIERNRILASFNQQ